MFPGGQDNRDALTDTSGVPVVAVKSGANKGCTLGNAATYYFLLGDSESDAIASLELASAEIAWAATVVATITLETCNFPAFERGGASGQPDVPDYEPSGAHWIPCNPSTAIVDVSGSGNTASAATVTTGGANTGAAMFDVGNLGARRARLKVVVTTGGLVRCGIHGKGAAK
ncbi:MAG TPA: hypothetical protein VGF94_08120 [Kofleriaceae bacterium]|jgi:hypothetical protein